MKHIEVYSGNNCPWCVRAKALLQSKGLDYEEINISSQAERTQEMVQRSGRRSIPQIFIYKAHIGGFDELSQLNRAGKLD
ncbi:MAG: glutaredoxin 3 [Halobacteria archaeon]|nr:glutaredoxin 3 [Halobacteria archaeon]